MASDHVIFGVHITNRIKDAIDIQRVFTEYGCNIKTRLGLHETGPGYCAPAGLVLLEVVGDEPTIEAFYQALDKIDGVQMQRMTFTHA
jgi:hypothetical protein